MKSAQKKQHIPIHKLEERTASGIEIRHLSMIDGDFKPMDAHRDDHYIFILQENGYTEVIIDFKEIRLEGCAVFYILPGQVHHVLRTSMSSGWFMAVDVSLVAVKYRTLFEELQSANQGIKLKEPEESDLKRCVVLLCDFFSQAISSAFHQPIVTSLVAAYIGMIARVYQASKPAELEGDSRPEMITRQFKKLLSSQFKTLKNPSDYASSLCLSHSYLNEVVKSVTGFSLSYWIQQEVILEAKRLLYYSELNVKEIAFSLGYEDHAYFSRLFSKISGCSPFQFRKNYRK